MVKIGSITHYAREIVTLRIEKTSEPGQAASNLCAALDDWGTISKSQHPGKRARSECNA